MRVARLVRVSTTSVAQSESPQNQLAYLAEEVVRQGWIDSGLVYQDELTGARVLDRPDVQRLMTDATNGTFDAVIMKSLSRLGRDTLGLLALKRRLDDLGVEIISLQDGYRSFRDPELIFLVFSDRAQAARLETGRNVRNGMLQKARRGLWTSGTVPFGYRRTDRNHLSADPEAAAIVRRIFALRQEGSSLSAVARALNDGGVPPPTFWQFQTKLTSARAQALSDPRYARRLARLKQRFAGRMRWRPSTVRVILTNTAYYGRLLWGRRYQRVLTGGQKATCIRPEAEWVMLNVEPILTEEDWLRAQCTRVRTRGGRSASGTPAPLAGLLRCGCCMSGEARLSATSFRRGPRLYRYYICQNRRNGGGCIAPSIRADELEEAVFTAIAAAVADLPPLTPACRSAGPPPLPGTARRRDLETALADLVEARLWRREEHRKGRLPATELAEELELLRRREEELRAELGELPAVERKDTIPAQLHEPLISTIERWAADLSPECRTQLLSSLVSLIVVSGADVEVRLRLREETCRPSPPVDVCRSINTVHRSVRNCAAHKNDEHR